ncbi:MAG: hypothetical protein ACOYOE_09145 [Chlorobium sp.]
MTSIDILFGKKFHTARRTFGNHCQHSFGLLEIVGGRVKFADNIIILLVQLFLFQQGIRQFEVQRSSLTSRHNPIATKNKSRYDYIEASGATTNPKFPKRQ